MAGVAAVTVLMGMAWWLDRAGRRPLPAGLRADAVVVAGCAVWPGGRPSPALARRVQLACRLYFRGVADTVVFTGAVGRHPPSEAVAAARLARSLGLPAAAVVVEERSTTTEENAQEAACLLAAGSSVVVVTDRWHVIRARRSFRRHFHRVEVVGTDRAPRRRQLRATVGEAVNLVRHRLRGTW